MAFDTAKQAAQSAAAQMLKDAQAAYDQEVAEEKLAATALADAKTTVAAIAAITQDPTLPAVGPQVTNLKAVANARGQVTLSWTDVVPEPAMHIVSRDGVEAGGGSPNWSGQFVGTADTYTFSNLADNILYTFTVQIPGGPAVTVKCTTQAAPSGNTTTNPVGTPSDFNTVAENGYKVAFAEDYNTPVALGQFGSSTYMSNHTAYDNFKSTDGIGMYSVAKVISVKNGYLDYYLHSENGQAYSAAVLPGGWAGFGPDSIVEFKMRVPDVATLGGFKQAILGWASTDSWGDGENDYAECDYGNANATPTWFLHGLGNNASSNIEAVNLGVLVRDWHVYRCVSTPNGVLMYVDGNLVKNHNSVWSRVAHRLVLQTETWFSSPPANSAGHVQFDWVKVQVPK